MKENKAYNLYHKANEFISLIKKRGYSHDHMGSICPKGRSTHILGEISGNRFLILYTYNKGKIDKFFDENISKLQEIAENF